MSQSDLIKLSIIGLVILIGIVVIIRELRKNRRELDLVVQNQKEIADRYGLMKDIL